MTTPDVGGGFGIKGFNYPEYFAVAFAARELGRPVHWMSARGEAMLTDNGGRDHVTVAEAAFDADYRLQALRIDCVSNLGAYNAPYGQLIASELALKVMPGRLRRAEGLLRGEGRLHQHHADRRLSRRRAAGGDLRHRAADGLVGARPRARPGRAAPAELHPARRSSPTAASRASSTTSATSTGCSTGRWPRPTSPASPARKAASARAGRLRGLGLAYYIESILGDQNETTTIAFAEDGMVELCVGTQSNGQGHETAFAQILHERSGIPFEKIRFVQGDSDRIAKGGGTGGSRSVTMQGNSINHAADEVIARFRPLAEEELEVAGADLVFEDGAFRIAGTDRAVDLMRARRGGARARARPSSWSPRASSSCPGRSYPNGAHFAEVEVDPETGRTEVVKYTVVDDFGYLINPMLAEGQVHGGVAQGIGQAVTEQVAFSPEGQLLSAARSWTTRMPRADDVPFMAFHAELVPSTANAIGMKGCGEAGTVGALAAVTNAALDALWDAGVRHVDMPLTPLRVWGWLQAARARPRNTAARVQPF